MNTMMMVPVVTQGLAPDALLVPGQATPAGESLPPDAFMALLIAQLSGDGTSLAIKTGETAALAANTLAGDGVSAGGESATGEAVSSQADAKDQATASPPVAVDIGALLVLLGVIQPKAATGNGGTSLTGESAAPVEAAGAVATVGPPVEAAGAVATAGPPVEAAGAVATAGPPVEAAGAVATAGPPVEAAGAVAIAGSPVDAATPLVEGAAVQGQVAAIAGPDVSGAASSPLLQAAGTAILEPAATGVPAGGEGKPAVDTNPQAGQIVAPPRPTASSGQTAPMVPQPVLESKQSAAHSQLRPGVDTPASPAAVTFASPTMADGQGGSAQAGPWQSPGQDGSPQAQPHQAAPSGPATPTFTVVSSDTTLAKHQTARGKSASESAPAPLAGPTTVVDGRAATPAQATSVPAQSPGSSYWQQMAGQITEQTATGVQMALGQNGKEAHIRLQPESLGQLDIHLVLDGNSVQVHVTAEHAQVGQIITTHWTQLRDTLATQGLQAADLAVSVGLGNTPHNLAGQQTRRNLARRKHDKEIAAITEESPVVPGSGQGRQLRRLLEDSSIEYWI